MFNLRSRHFKEVLYQKNEKKRLQYISIKTRYYVARTVFRSSTDYPVCEPDQGSQPDPTNNKKKKKNRSALNTNLLFSGFNGLVVSS